MADAHPEAEPGSIEDVESEYHQPPQPAEAGMGETITLTGTNIGVRLRVTVTGVERVDDHQAVHLELESTGITNYDGEFTQAAVTYGDGTTQPLAKGANAPCSNSLDLPTAFIAVGAKTTGCLLFPTSDRSHRRASNSRSRRCPPRPAGSGTSTSNACGASDCPPHGARCGRTAGSGGDGRRALRLGGGGWLRGVCRPR